MSSLDLPVTFVSPPRRAAWRAYAIAAAWVGATTVACAALSHALDVTSLTMVFLLGVVGTAMTGGRGPAVVASVASVAAYDFLFVPPRFTFWVEDPRAWLTFVVMLVVGLLLGTLTLRLREEAEAARASEARLAALYALSRELSSVPDRAQLPDTVAQVVARVSACPAVVLLPSAPGALAPRAGEVFAWRTDPAEAEAANWTFAQQFPSGCGTPQFETARWFYVPLIAGGAPLGVLAVQPPSPDAVAALAPVVQAMANHAARAMEQFAS